MHHPVVTEEQKPGDQERTSHDARVDNGPVRIVGFPKIFRRVNVDLLAMIQDVSEISLNELIYQTRLE
jgi:hypothetical protein